jgi:hypothetical protein
MGRLFSVCEGNLKMRKNAHLLFIVSLFAMLFIQGCEAASSVPTPHMDIVTDFSYRVSTQIVNGTFEPPPGTPTPPVSDPDGVFVSLSTAYQPPNPVYVKLRQKLYVISPAGFGSYGWNLSFDHSFFQLDSRNAPKSGSPGYWIWIPLKTGNSQIEIQEAPWPCMNTTPPCTPPQFFARLNVEVTQ